MQSVNYPWLGNQAPTYLKQKQKNININFITKKKYKYNFIITILNGNTSLNKVW